MQIDDFQHNGKVSDLRVTLVDFYRTGHHESYLQALTKNLEKLNVPYLVVGPSSFGQFISPKNFFMLSGCDNLVGLKGIKRLIKIFQLCRLAIDNANNWGATHIHFVYVDWIISGITTAWLSKKTSALPIITVHWSSNVGLSGRVKERLFRSHNRWSLIWFVNKKNARVLVHHKIVSEELGKIISQNKIGVVPYPITHLTAIPQLKKKEFRKCIGIPDSATLLLCYGNTRFDKGADLAVKALCFLPDSYHLLVAGSPQNFQPQDLLDLVTEDEIKERLHIIPRFIEDEETALIFYSCDIVLIPYRRTFSGQSGPLTLAAAIGKPVVVANLPVLNATVQFFRLGFVFPAEDILAMAEVILTADNWKPAYDDTTMFVNQHSSSTFTNSVLSNYLLKHKDN